MKFFILTLLLSWNTYGYSQNLIPDECAYVQQNDKVAFNATSNLTPDFMTESLVATNSMSLTCQEIKEFKQGLEIVSVAMLPASMILASPEIKSALTAQAVSLGLSITNPVVLTVGAIGVAGAITMYLVIRETEATCRQMEREALKQELLFELEKKMQMNARPNIKFDINL